MKITVIIVNYRVKYYLAQCLHSVAKAMEGIEGQVIVVDNDSQDDSVDFNRQLYPQVQFIENKENMERIGLILLWYCFLNFQFGTTFIYIFLI